MCALVLAFTQKLLLYADRRPTAWRRLPNRRMLAALVLSEITYPGAKVTARWLEYFWGFIYLL